MKQLFLLLVVLLMVCSCSDEILNEENHQAILGASNVAFSFDSITEPSNWSKYQSLEEMLAACQIPEDILKLMSTDELIEVCISHPLRTNFVFYNDEIRGARVIINNFNGFQELKRRSDAPEIIIAFYEDIYFNAQVEKKYNKNYSDITYRAFIELFLASNEMPILYSGQNGTQLEMVSNKVLERKLNETDVDIYDISHSLLINARIKLENDLVSNEEKDVLNRFMTKGGRLGNLEEYTKISRIISK